MVKTKIIKFKDVKSLKIRNGVVSCGDIHLFNSYPYNDNTKVISSRLNDIHKAFNKAGQSAKILDLPLILNGDIIMSGIFDYPVEYILTKFLKKYSDVEIHINLGNHDFDGENSVIKPLVEYGKSSLHKVYDSPTVVKSGKMLFHFAPYQRKIEALRSLKKLSKKIDKSLINILFIHNQFVGTRYANKIKSKSGLSQGLFNEGQFKEYALVIASHIHKFQHICQSKGIYTSSLIPLNFGERRKEHGFHIFDVDKMIDYFIIPKAPRFVYIDYKNLKKYGDDQLKQKVSGNIVCIRKSKNMQTNKKKITKKLKLSGARYVTFKSVVGDKKEIKKEALESKNVEELVSHYSKVIAKEDKKLKFEKIEEIGLEILREAQQAKSATERG